MTNEDAALFRLAASTALARYDNLLAMYENGGGKDWARARELSREYEALMERVRVALRRTDKEQT